MPQPAPAPQVVVANHDPLFCPHCGSQQSKSVLIAPQQNPPTVCLACKRGVRLTGPLWFDKLSELEPDAAILPTIRIVVAQLTGEGQKPVLA